MKALLQKHTQRYKDTDTETDRNIQRNIHTQNRYIYTETYGTAKKKRPGYLVGNLVATNWPIEKALHAIGYNQIPTK